MAPSKGVVGALCGDQAAPLCWVAVRGFRLRRCCWVLLCGDQAAPLCWGCCAGNQTAPLFFAGFAVRGSGRAALLGCCAGVWAAPLLQGLLGGDQAAPLLAGLRCRSGRAAVCWAVPLLMDFAVLTLLCCFVVLTLLAV